MCIASSPSASTGAGEAPLPRPQNNDGFADEQARHLHRPTKSGAQRIKQYRQLGRHVLRHAMHEGVRREVQMRRVAAPERGFQRGGTEAVDGHRVAATTQAILALDAGRTVSAGQQRLDGHAVATATPQRRAASSPIWSITPTGSWPGITG